MEKRAALIGFGRFGEAFAGLLRAAGVELGAYDEHREIPDDFAASNLIELIKRSPFVVLAVPVPAMESVLRKINDALTAEHVVIDVGSVKTGPTDAMQRQLGDRIPWVATHPLFGPASLMRNERPLNVVVCPNDQHPAAVDRVTRFYQQIGCIVTQQNAEAHDRIMAETHAMAFFLAKGLVEIKAGENADVVPPSFRALEAAIDAVRSDAGHLFNAIQLENPFAEAARTRLLSELTRIHEELGGRALL